MNAFLNIKAAAALADGIYTGTTFAGYSFNKEETQVTLRFNTAAGQAKLSFGSTEGSLAYFQRCITEILEAQGHPGHGSLTDLTDTPFNLELRLKEDVYQGKDGVERKVKFNAFVAAYPI
jgi:hypothetical protein